MCSRLFFRQTCFSITITMASNEEETRERVIPEIMVKSASELYIITLNNTSFKLRPYDPHDIEVLISQRKVMEQFKELKELEKRIQFSTGSQASFSRGSHRNKVYNDGFEYSSQFFRCNSENPSGP